MARDPDTRMPARPLTNTSRRTLLQAAAVGTAAVGVWGAARALGIEGDVAAADEPMGAPILAYVRDARSGEVVVMTGAREIVRNDRQLAARLIAIAKEANDVIAS